MLPINLIPLKDKQGAQKGFTLVEMIVSLGLFTVVVLMGISVLASVGDASRRAQAERIVIDNLNLAVENISRNLRVGVDYYCFTVGTFDTEPPANARQNVENDTGDCEEGNGIAFDNSDNERVAFWHDADPDVLAVNRSIQTRQGWETHSITAPEISVNSLRFEVQGTADNDSLQPMVFIIISGEADAGDTVEEFNIQTTITRRQYQDE